MKKWTEEEDRYIQDNISLPVSKIAEYLGRSRNSVIGRIHRQGFRKKHDVPVNQKPVVKKRKKPIPVSGSIPLREIQSGQCRYSQGSGADMACCGKATYKKYSYCFGCCNIVFLSGWDEEKPIKIRSDYF